MMSAFLRTAIWRTHSECVFVKASLGSTYIDHLHRFLHELLIAGINPHLLMSDRGYYMFTYAALSLLRGPGTVHHAWLFF